MKDSWYYEQNGERHGPVNSKTLKQLALDGIIRPKTPVWRNGLKKWVKAEAVKGLVPPVQPGIQKDFVAPLDVAKDDPPSGAASYTLLLYTVVPSLLLCCFPLGLLTLWIPQYWELKTKWLLTAVCLGFHLLVLPLLFQNVERARIAASTVSTSGIPENITAAPNEQLDEISSGLHSGIENDEPQYAAPARTPQSVEKENPDSQDEKPSLTREFLIPEVGTTLNYSEDIINPTSDGSGSFRIVSEHKFVEQGQANVSMTNIFPTFSSSVDVTWEIEKSIRKSQVFFSYYCAEICVGARVGDMWTSEDGSETHKLVRLGNESGVEEAVIETTGAGSFHARGDSRTDAITVLRKGVGIVSHKMYWNMDQKQRLGRRIQLVLAPEREGDDGESVLRRHNSNISETDTGALAESESDIRHKLAGSRWVNSNSAIFEWKMDGRLIHNGVERTWEVIDSHRGRIIFAKDHIGILEFNEDFTQFKQLIRGGPASFQGRRLR